MSDELRPEYEFNYYLAKPNRFAADLKNAWRGIDRIEAIAIARGLASVEDAPPLGVQSGWPLTETSDFGWIVSLHPTTMDDIVVDGLTGEARWARMTAEEWRKSTDPRAMLLAARRRVDPLMLWLFVCMFGHRLWDHFSHEAQRIAIVTTERWLDGQESEDELNFRWFNATGGGAGLNSGWAVADELLQHRLATITKQEACDLIRQVLPNPFENDR